MRNYNWILLRTGKPSHPPQKLTRVIGIKIWKLRGKKLFSLTKTRKDVMALSNLQIRVSSQEVNSTQKLVCLGIFLKR